MSDSSPGAIAEISGRKYRLYNGRILPYKLRDFAGAKPGDIIGQSNSAICLQTSDYQIWVTHAKDMSSEKSGKCLKLPA